MKALLLNSGVGLRMGSYTEHAPKCMCEIGLSQTIISWQLTQLARCGIKDVLITTGPFQDRLKVHIDELHLPLSITYVPNPLFRETNYIYSMHLAAPHLVGDVLLLHGDLVLEPAAYDMLFEKGPSVVAVDRGLPLPEKDFKAKLGGGLVRGIGLSFFGEDCVACQPAYRLNEPDFNAWMAQIDDFCQRGETNVYAENALNPILHDKVSLHPLDMGGRLCLEVDNEKDLREVSARFVKTCGREAGGIQ